MARFVVVGIFATVGIVWACSGEDEPPFAEDLGEDTAPTGGVTDREPLDGGVVDGDDGGVPAYTPVIEDDSNNQAIFDDPAIGFAPQASFARFREDCIAPGRLEIGLTDDPLCGPGNQQLTIDLSADEGPGTFEIGADRERVGVTFRDADGTIFSNAPDCPLGTGQVRLDAIDPLEAGATQRVFLESVQLFDCANVRPPLTIDGAIEARLETTFAEACETTP